MTRNAHHKPTRQTQPVRPKWVMREYIHSLRGSLKGGQALKTLEEERAHDLEREELKFMRFNKRPRP